MRCKKVEGARERGERNGRREKQQGEEKEKRGRGVGSKRKEMQVRELEGRRGRKKRRTRRLIPQPFLRLGASRNVPLPSTRCPQQVQPPPSWDTQPLFFPITP